MRLPNLHVQNAGGCGRLLLWTLLPANRGGVKRACFKEMSIF